VPLVRQVNTWRHLRATAWTRLFGGPYKTLHPTKHRTTDTAVRLRAQRGLGRTPYPRRLYHTAALITAGRYRRGTRAFLRLAHLPFGLVYGCRLSGVPPPTILFAFLPPAPALFSLYSTCSSTGGTAAAVRPYHS